MPIMITQNGGASYYLYPSYYTNLVAHMPMMISQKRAPPTTTSTPPTTLT